MRVIDGRHPFCVEGGPAGVWKAIVAVNSKLHIDNVWMQSCMAEAHFRWVWKGDDFCVLSVKGLRRLISSKGSGQHNFVLHWSKLMPNKVNLFVWGAQRNRIATGDALIERNIQALRCADCVTKGCCLFANEVVLKKITVSRSACMDDAPTSY
ncbi:hypothetical protein SSX86_012518 [Deinandra increscens subsp. villosa]|uniref:Reverse transcriptase zinc-binding domain-containing protein n=1 Tax=Deinandra increscens subsp. villosa TaxID=3103831 RepID=A0AAP0D8T4_9ASTR